MESPSHISRAVPVTLNTLLNDQLFTDHLE